MHFTTKLFSITFFVTDILRLINQNEIRSIALKVSVVVSIACPAGCQTCGINANGNTVCTSGGCLAAGYAQVATTSCVGEFNVLPKNTDNGSGNYIQHITW